MGGPVTPQIDLSKCVYTDHYYAFQRREYKKEPSEPEILVRMIVGLDGEFLGGFTHKAVEEVETGRRFTSFIGNFRYLNAMEVVAWHARGE